MNRRDVITGAVALTGMALTAGAAAQVQTSDARFKPQPVTPAFKDRPRLVIDQAHGNFHTRDGRYAPFAAVMAADGWDVQAGTAPFTADSLEGTRLLVIANAGQNGKPAFTPEESNVLTQWVRSGGALWFIADHAPFGAAASGLAAAFGFEMGKGWVFEPGRRNPSQIDYTPTTGLLPHPVTQGLKRVRAFTGQSLSLPSGASGLLKLGPEAREAATQDQIGDSRLPVLKDRYQGFAMDYGQGRLIGQGEAGMLSAQVFNRPDGGRIEMGMNVAGLDNETFARNAARWLGRAL
ncbi:DUF4350 domain-containing protein [Asticcacaulis sp. BYS171W]|uniref:DUF4350 domain-containing protein n=1 Tax=Asticcacaulis aquaticus TaxID=2984212 RepID=A0ABT5HTZ1_9CAUL|nr:DUF4350 domain-containing protein [Asticcacaulis aquaticus]MDC7683536.1 DUF4350 domain-containing protein [Asticcacaulis aquaticus]